MSEFFNNTATVEALNQEIDNTEQIRLLTTQQNEVGKILIDMVAAIELLNQRAKSQARWNLALTMILYGVLIGVGFYGYVQR